MRPLDPRLAPHLRPARSPLVLAMSATLAAGLLTIVQVLLGEGAYALAPSKPLPVLSALSA